MKDAGLLTIERIAQAYRVPPWIMVPGYPAPRHPRVAFLWLRLRWWIREHAA